MSKWQWTLSGRIIPSDETDSQVQPDSGSMEEYFCVTSPPRDKDPFCSEDWPHVVTDRDTPTVIAELYHNIKGGTPAVDAVLKKVNDAIQHCICACTTKKIW